MTTFPRSLRLLKGALVNIDIFNSLATVVVFQYNSTTLTRSLQPAGAHTVIYPCASVDHPLTRERIVHCGFGDLEDLADVSKLNDNIII
jgi:hypothetical protein